MSVFGVGIEGRRISVIVEAAMSTGIQSIVLSSNIGIARMEG